MVITGQPVTFRYKFATRATAAEGRSLPVSTQLDDTRWITIPWDQIVDDPEGKVAAGAWTFLYGPCVAIITGEVGLMNADPEAQSHIRLYETAAQDGPEVFGHNAWEWQIGSRESHTVHLDGTWVVNLAAGRRLRMCVDYWNSTSGPASIYRANVQGIYWRT